MTPKKPEWIELTESGDSYAGIKKVNKRLPLVTLVVAGAVILGGSVFATTNNEPSAVAETPTASQSIAAAQPNVSTASNNSNSAPAPTASQSIAAAQPNVSTASNNSNSAPAPTAPKAKSSSGTNALPVPKVTAAPQRGEGHERGEGGEGRERDHEDREDD